jgi:hypothetical protein
MGTADADKVIQFTSALSRRLQSLRAPWLVRPSILSWLPERMLSGESFFLRHLGERRHRSGDLPKTLPLYLPLLPPSDKAMLA